MKKKIFSLKIFSKKSKESENSGAINVAEEQIESNSDHFSNQSGCRQTLSVPEVDSKSCFSDILPKSPISPRVKNIQEDMEALMLSRQDNPYIMQQLERLSTKESELFAELQVSANSSPARTIHKLSITNLEPNPTFDSNFIMDSDISDSFDYNLHDKLIRSPPPQFPKNLSLFVFPGSSAPSVQNLLLSPNLKYHSNCDMKSRCSDTSNDSIPFNYKNKDLKNSKRSPFLDPSPQNQIRYERRGSDSSIMSNNWKTSFYNQSMTASSSSLLSFVPRYSTINSCNSVSKDSNMSCNECQNIETNQKSAIDLMEVYSNLDVDNSDQVVNFMSPSNSREALLKDDSQIT